MRRTLKRVSVVLQVAHCGICHSDLHQVLNEWKNTKFPCLPGHEITGIVTEVGANVTKFKVRLSLHITLCAAILHLTVLRRFNRWR